MDGIGGIKEWSRRQISRLWYLFLVLVMFYMAGWYRMYGLLLLAGGGLLIFLLMGLIPWYLARQLEFSVELSEHVIKRGGETAGRVAVRNRGVLPAPRLTITLRYLSGIDEPASIQTRQLFFQGAAGTRGRSFLPFDVPGPHCGVTEIQVSQVMITDYLNLFVRRLSWHRKRPPADRLTVIPAQPGMRIQADSIQGGSWSQEQAEQLLRENFYRNIDPYEIRQIRSYLPGDSMRDIHWKLSARTGQLMSKQYQRDEEIQIGLYLDLCCQEPVDFDDLDAFREVAVSVSAGLLQAGITHAVCWYGGTQDGLCRRMVQRPEDLLMMAADFVRAPLIQSGYQEQMPGIQQFIHEHISLYLGMDLRLYRDRRLLAEFSRDGYEDEIRKRWLKI